MRHYESTLSRLEKAAINLHNILWQNSGPNSEWPITINFNDEKPAKKLGKAFYDLAEAVHEIRPELCQWPITREIPGLESWRMTEGEPGESE